jgi:NAD+ kinase
MLDIKVGKKIFRAVNEAVVKGLYRIVDLQLTVNNEPFLRVLGDGVIVSTQTGSTAYSLSAGGAIVDPEVDCLLITPVNPTGLPIPSMVLSPRDVITIKVKKGSDISLVIDGQVNTKLEEGQEVIFKRGVHNVKLGYFEKEQFLKALNAKFGLAGRAAG